MRVCGVFVRVCGVFVRVCGVFVGGTTCGGWWEFIGGK